MHNQQIKPNHKITITNQNHSPNKPQLTKQTNNRHYNHQITNSITSNKPTIRSLTSNNIPVNPNNINKPANAIVKYK